jgi:WhiB family redox-sensing transcriptional regulator
MPHVRAFDGDCSWISGAACATYPHPDAFYPGRGHDAREARAVCAGCSVRLACLRYALQVGHRHGIWGGTIYLERMRIKRILLEWGVDVRA